MQATIVLLPGDGVGPEVVAEALRVLQAVAEGAGHDFTFQNHLIGGAAIDAHGTALGDEALDACRKADGIILGAVGGPKWDDPEAAIRPEQGLLTLRQELKLFANLRPVVAIEALIDGSPLKPERMRGVDIMMVRELTGGIYFGKPRERRTVDGDEEALDTMVYARSEVERIVRLACKIAQGRKGLVTSVDKANVLESSRLWRRVAEEVAADFPDVRLEHQLVDSAAMKLITQAADFDVMVTGNMFGDILSDEASVLVGSLGMLPSASLGESSLGLYEPIHGSAPDIAGKGIANPIGMILSAAMLLRHSLSLENEAKSVEEAVATVLDKGLRTRDLSAEGSIGTSEMGAAIAETVRTNYQN